MALNQGTRFGPYEILELAGSGGMGEVYKARDARLDRTVAIKVLPAHASANPESKQRFEREAQAIANLKHPNICVLHDIGREDGTDFIVMEYLQGETLADRIARERGRPASGASAAGAAKPGSSSARAASHTGNGKSETTPGGRALKLDEALHIAIQIADALDQAHQHGVIHRDLKPANVMLVSSGGSSQSGASHVKLLDFGLAKLTTPDDAIATANTGQADLTGPGVVLGTVRYMSPEQIEGRPVDARTDIFAFGTVLYELLTGRRAFDGKTQSSVIAAIMNVDPMPVSELVPITPKALDRLVTRCLAKDPDDRWQSVHDLLIQLRWIAGRKERGQAASAAPATRERWTVAAIAASLLVVAGMGVPAYRYVRGAAEPDEFRFRVPAIGLSTADFALSPDGETIALIARPGGDGAAIWVRRVHAINYRRLEGTEGATQPFWSPDSTLIGFVAGGRMKKVAASGSPPQEISSISGVFYGGTWSADGAILFGTTTGLRRVSAQGGTPEPVTNVEQMESGHFWPHFLPDGKRYLYTAWSTEADKRAIVAGTLGSSEKTQVVPVGSNAQYAQGYLLFRRDTTLMAQPFDARRLQTSGEPVQITGDVGGNLSNGRSYFQVSQRGNLLYFQGGATGAAGTGRAAVTPNWQFGWHTRAGRLIREAGDNGPHGDADVSPDEKLVAVTRQEPGAAGSDIWVMDTQRGVSTKLTLDPADDMNPVWDGAGKRVAFTSFRKGNADIFVKNANGVGPETPLVDSPADEFVEDWSKDGRYLVYKQAEGEAEDLYVLPFEADGKPGKPFPVMQGPYHKDEPQFSYDGKWLAYGSDESGRFEVYVVSFPELDQKIKVSNEGASRPRWRKDSREIYYMRTRSGVMAADFIPGPKIEAGVPHLLYTSNATAGADPTRHLFDVSPDGQRFFQRTFASIAGANVAGGGVPTVPANFTSAAPADGDAAPPAAPANPNTAANNGLTVIRHWTTPVRKAVK